MRCDAPVTASDPFKWRHYPGDIVLWCVRGDDHRSREWREHERHEREERRERERARERYHYNNGGDSYGNGYYSQPRGYYDRYGYWHQY